MRFLSIAGGGCQQCQAPNDYRPIGTQADYLQYPSEPDRTSAERARVSHSAADTLRGIMRALCTAVPRVTRIPGLGA